MENRTRPPLVGRVAELRTHTVKRHLANGVLKLGLASRQALAWVAVGPRT